MHTENTHPPTSTMFRFIAATLTLLALSVSGLPTDNPDVGLTNTSASTIEHNAGLDPFPITRCNWAGAPDGFYMDGLCTCWSMPVGVDHHYFDLAIAEACESWTGGIGDPVELYGLADGLSQGQLIPSSPLTELLN